MWFLILSFLFLAASLVFWAWMMCVKLPEMEDKLNQDIEDMFKNLTRRNNLP